MPSPASSKNTSINQLLQLSHEQLSVARTSARNTSFEALPLRTPLSWDQIAVLGDLIEKGLEISDPIELSQKLERTLRRIWEFDTKRSVDSIGLEFALPSEKSFLQAIVAEYDQWVQSYLKSGPSTILANLNWDLKRDVYKYSIWEIATWWDNVDKFQLEGSSEIQTKNLSPLSVSILNTILSSIHIFHNCRFALYMDFAPHTFCMPSPEKVTRNEIDTAVNDLLSREYSTPNIHSRWARAKSVRLNQSEYGHYVDIKLYLSTQEEGLWRLKFYVNRDAPQNGVADLLGYVSEEPLREKLDVVVEGRIDSSDLTVVHYDVEKPYTFMLRERAHQIARKENPRHCSPVTAHTQLSCENGEYRLLKRLSAGYGKLDVVERELPLDFTLPSQWNSSLHVLGGPVFKSVIEGMQKSEKLKSLQFDVYRSARKIQKSQNWEKRAIEESGFDQSWEILTVKKPENLENKKSSDVPIYGKLPHFDEKSKHILGAISDTDRLKSNFGIEIKNIEELKAIAIFRLKTGKSFFEFIQSLMKGFEKKVNANGSFLEITGLPGSGKSLALSILREFSEDRVVIFDIDSAIFNVLGPQLKGIEENSELIKVLSNKWSKTLIRTIAKCIGHELNRRGYIFVINSEEPQSIAQRTLYVDRRDYEIGDFLIHPIPSNPDSYNAEDHKMFADMLSLYSRREQSREMVEVPNSPQDLKKLNVLKLSRTPREVRAYLNRFSDYVAWHNKELAEVNERCSATGLSREAMRQIYKRAIDDVYILNNPSENNLRQRIANMKAQIYPHLRVLD